MPLSQIERLCQPIMMNNATQQAERNDTGFACQITTRDCEQATEAYAMLLVQAKTSIPTPRVLRMFVDDGSDSCTIVLERVEGKALKTCWETMTLRQKISVAKILRRYVKALRDIQTTQVRLQVPGPILGEKQSQESRAFVGWVDDVNDVGPFEFQSEMARWFNERLRKSYDFHDTESYMIPFDNTKPLVFVMGSLSMDKIIIDDDGCLWLTDFGRAGVYPPWFEYCGMRGNLYNKLPQSWKWLRRFVCGPYRDQERFLRQVNRVPVKSRKRALTRKYTKSLHRLSRRPTIQTVPEISIEGPSR